MPRTLLHVLSNPESYCELRSRAENLLTKRFNGRKSQPIAHRQSKRLHQFTSRVKSKGLNDSFGKTQDVPWFATNSRGKNEFSRENSFSNLHCEVCVAAWKHCMGFMLCGNIEPPCPHLSFDTMENVRMKLMFFVFLLCAAPAWCGVPGGVSSTSSGLQA